MKRHGISDEENATSEKSGVGKRQAKKKKKEFAWMSSEDEDDDDDDNKSEDVGKAEAGSGSEDDNLEVSVTVLSEAATFGQLVRLAPSLLKKLKADKLEAPDVAAAYRALGRTKFFDGEVLEGLNKCLRKLFKDGKASEALASDAIECLFVLNAYDKAVFSSVATSFRATLPLLDVDLRKKWLRCFQFFKHDSDREFVQMLEVAPMALTHPGYKRVRCQHLGDCALGAACTFSHDPRALPSLDFCSDTGTRSSSVMLTQCQVSQGRGAYTNTPSFGRSK